MKMTRFGVVAVVAVLLMAGTAHAVSGAGGIVNYPSVVGETTGTGATSLGSVDVSVPFSSFTPFTGGSLDVETQCTARNMTASPHTSKFLRRHTVFVWSGSAWVYKGSDLLGSVLGDLDLSMALINTSVSAAGGTSISVDVNGVSSVDIYWVCSVSLQLGIVN